MRRDAYRAWRCLGVCLGPTLLLMVAPAVSRAADGFRTREADLVVGHYAPPRAESEDSLIVVSYNIQYGEKIDAALADLRGNPILARADILLLQEMDPEGCDRIARELRRDFVYYPASVHPHHGRLFGNAVLTRGRVAGQGFTLLPTRGPLAGTPRIAVFADLEFGARRVRAVSVHGSTVMLPAEERRRQVRTVLDRHASGTSPLIIGGDFNTVSSWDAVRLVRDMRHAGLREARANGGTTPRHGWLRFLGVEGRLDHIFFRGMSAGRAGADSSATASDHYPVWVVLDWSDGAPKQAPGPSAGDAR